MKFYLMALGAYIDGPYDSYDEAEGAITTNPDLVETNGQRIFRDKIHICAEDNECAWQKETNETLEDSDHKYCTQCRSQRIYISRNGYDTVMVCTKCHFEEHIG